jgi:hypothetical protein
MSFGKSQTGQVHPADESIDVDQIKRKIVVREATHYSSKQLKDESDSDNEEDDENQDIFNESPEVIDQSHSQLMQKLKSINRDAATDKKQNNRSSQRDISQTKESSGVPQLHDFNPSATDQSVNKAVFRKKYGVEQKFPYNYILDSKVVPTKPNQVIKVMKYIIPKHGTDLRVYEVDKDPEVIEMNKFFSTKVFEYKNVVFQLFEFQDKQGIKMIKEVPVFDAYVVNIQFSRDGKYFAVLRRGLNNLQIYEVKNNNIEELLERVSKKEFLIELSGLE